MSSQADARGLAIGPAPGATVDSLPLEDARARLASRAGLTLRTGPVSVRIHTRIEQVARAITELYASYPLLNDEAFCDFEVSIRRPVGPKGWWGRQVTFEMDGQRPFNPLAGDQGFPLLEWGLNWCVYGMCHQYLVLHAAVLERNGKALVMPAPSGSGKSTLCAGLAMSGWRLLSDELALIDPSSGAIVPMPRPVSVKNRSIEVLSNLFPTLRFGSVVKETVKGVVAHFPAPEEAVARAHETALPAWVILPKWQEGSPAQLSRIPRARGHMSLVENAFNYDLFGALGFDVLADVVARSACYTFQYGHLPDALACFAALADGSHRD